MPIKPMKSLVQLTPRAAASTILALTNSRTGHPVFLTLPKRTENIEGICTGFKLIGGASIVPTGVGRVLVDGKEPPMISRMKASLESL
jgi:hypothetical protein